MPPALTLLVGLLAVFAAGVTYGLTGFGFALVATPLLVLFLPPRTVVPLVLLLSMITGGVILLQARRAVRLRRIWPLLIAGLAGVPLGSWLLLAASAHTLQMLMGVTVTLAALAFLAGFRQPIGAERLALVPIGLVSGVLSGALGMSGPPVVLFLANQGVEKETFRANLCAYFMVLNLLTLPTYLAIGVITPQVLRYTALYAPALALGVFLGIWLLPHVPERAFRRVALVLVLAAGVSALWGALR
jgi:uncharacterized protein